MTCNENLVPLEIWVFPSGTINTSVYSLTSTSSLSTFSLSFTTSSLPEAQGPGGVDVGGLRTVRGG